MYKNKNKSIYQYYIGLIHWAKLGGPSLGALLEGPDWGPWFVGPQLVVPKLVGLSSVASVGGQP